MDLWTYQELLVEQEIDWVLETGTNQGGSAYFLASIMDLLGRGQVITVDTEDHPARPLHPRIEYIRGSSTSPDIIAHLQERVGENSNCLVILDSDHRRDHVLNELRLYQNFVSEGGYLIVEDTNVNGHPTCKEFGPGPHEAMEAFLAENDHFEIDPGRERFLMTLNPNGFLRRVKPLA